MHRPQQTSLSNSSFTIWTTWTRCSQVSESPQNAKLWQERDKKRNLVLILSWLCEAMSRWCIFFRSVPQCCATWAQKSFREHFALHQTPWPQVAVEHVLSFCFRSRPNLGGKFSWSGHRRTFRTDQKRVVQSMRIWATSPRWEMLRKVADEVKACENNAVLSGVTCERNSACTRKNGLKHISNQWLYTVCVYVYLYIYCLLYITSFNKQKVWFAILHLEMLAIFRYITSNIYKCRYWHEFLRAISIVIVVVKLVQCTVISVV